MKKPPLDRAARRRRLATRVLLAILVLVLLRVALGFALAPIAVAAAGAAGFDLTAERVALRVLGGELTLARVTLTPQRSAAKGPLLELDHLRADVALTALLRGALRLERVDVDGVRLRLERLPDGRLALPEGEAQDTEASEPRGQEAEPMDPASWRSPIEVGALRATRLELHWTDHSVRPAARALFQAEFGLHNLGVEGRTARLDGFARGRGDDGAPLLESASFVAQLRQEDGLDAEVEGEVVGLVLEPLGSLLSAFGLQPDGLRRDGAFRVEGRLEEQVDGWSARVQLGPAHWSVDGARWLALESGELHGRRVLDAREGASSDAGKWVVERVGVEGVRVRVERRADGLLAAAGLALGGAKGPPLFAPQPEAPPRQGETRAPAPAAEPSWPALVLRRLEAADAALEFVDRLPEPAVEIVASLSEASLLGLDWVQPGAPPARWRVHADVIDTARGLRSTGELAVDGMSLKAEGAVALDALEWRALAPYLAAAGLRREGPDRRAAANLSAVLGQGPAGWSFGASLRDLVLGVDGETPDARLDLVQWKGASLGDGALDLGTLDFEGGALHLELEPTGQWAFAGLVQGPATPLPEARGGKSPSDARASEGTRTSEETRAPDVADRPAGNGPAEPPLAVALTRLSARDLVVAVVERGSTRRVDGRLDWAELGPLAWSGSAPAEAPYRARAEVPGLVESAVVEGRLRAEGLSLGLDGALAVDGLALARLEPFWPADVPRPLWQEGSLRAGWTVGLELGPGGPSAALTVRDVALAEAGELLAGLELLELGPAHFAGSVAGGLDLGPVRVRGARLAAERAADGTVSVAGVALFEPQSQVARNPAPEDESGRLGGGGGSSASDTPPEGSVAEAAEVRAPEPTPTERPTPTRAAPRPPEAPRPVAPPVAAAAKNSPTTLPALALGPVVLEDLALHWRDGLAQVETALVLDVELARLDTRAGGEVPLEVRAAVEGSADQLRAAGFLQLDPANLRLELALSADGLRAGPLSAYLPETVRFDAPDRAARAELRSGVALAADGLRNLFVELADVHLGPAAGAADLSLRSLRARVHHLASDQSTIDVEEVVLEGLELEASVNGEGGIGALGLLWQPAERSEMELDAPAPEAAPVAATPPAETAPTTTAPPAPARAAPRITVGRFDLELARFAIRDKSALADAVPFEIHGRLATPGPLVLLDPTPESLAPWKLALSGSAPPAARAFRLDVSLSPFVDEPRAELIASAEGLSSAGLLASLPSLERWVSAGNLEEGTAAAKLNAELSWRRRGPLDFSLADGFGAEVHLSGAELRAGPEGERLLGLEDLFVDVRQFQPSTGDLHIASLEFERPSLRATLREGSLEVLGFRFPMDTDTGDPDAEGAVDAADSAQRDATEAADESAKPPTADAVATAAAPTPTLLGPTVRIDSIVGRGLDVELRDETASPALHIPLDRLDFEVRGLTTRALVEPVPIGFALYVGAGEVELPRRLPFRSLLGGIASRATSALGASSRERGDLESRPLFGEFALVGRIAPAPVPVGWARVELDGFELTSLRGKASSARVDISDGTMDFRARFDFEPDATIDVETGTAFSYLSLSEPANGPISSFLSLPAPLDSVLYVLRNDDGEQRIALNFRLTASGLSAANLAATASRALGRLITDAIASSPLRITGGLTDLVGLTGGGDQRPRETTPTGEVSFEPGSILLESRSATGLNTVVKRLKDDPELRVVLEHRFGAADLVRAGRFANPTPEDTRQLGRELEARRNSLARRRAIAAVDVRSAYALGAQAAAEARRMELLALDAELAASEDALDELYELLRPGADRRADRRTRAAAMAVAALRQDRVRDALIARGGPEGEGRIEVRRARYEPDERELGAVLLFERGGTPKRSFFGRILGFFGL